MFSSGSQIHTLVDLLRWRADQQPNRVAYTFLADGESKEIQLTYGELDRQAQMIAAQLQTLAAPGDRAMLLYPSGLDFMAGFFGCLYAGIIAVPAYPPHGRRPSPRLHSIISNAEPKLALTTQELWPKISKQFSDHPTASNAFVLPTDTFHADSSLAWQPQSIAGDTLAFLQYTSGSTGTAKGVMVAHTNILHNEAMVAAGFENTEDIVGVNWLPLFHDMGLIGSVLQPLYVGCQAVLLSPVDFLQKPIRWLRAISRYHNTTCGAPDFGYAYCAQMIKPEECEGLDLSGWRVAFSGAEPVRIATLQRFNERFAPYGFRWNTFYPGYGLAEATLFVTGGYSTVPPISVTVDRRTLESEHVAVPQLAEPQTEGGLTLVSCGHSWLGQQVMIVDPETCTRCPEWHVGEVWVAGPSVAQGYWQQPQATAETFQAYLADTGEGPFLRTGDLGFLRGEELFVTGRLKDLIIIRGRNHYPQDIEQTVEQSHPSLQLGAGAAFTVEVNGEDRLVIIHEVKRTHRRTLNLDEVLGNIRQAVAQEHQLQIYATVLLEPGSVPKTSSGKIQRRTCREAFLAHTLEAIHHTGVGDAASDRPETVAQLSHSQPEPLTNQPGTKLLGRLGGRVDLMGEAILDPALMLNGAKPYQSHNTPSPKTIFLTGATGFLGVHLLYELLRQTQATIHCLIRSSDPAAGFERLQQKLATNQLWDEAFRPRIIPVVGDLSLPLLGIDPQHFAQLTEQIDVIYHNGAIVNFMQPYSAIKPANVAGTQEIIRLAVTSKVKPLHHVSTLFVFGVGPRVAGRLIQESDPADAVDELWMGYAQSKWVAEQLVMQAHERGLPVSIYRPGIIVGNSQTGIWDNWDDFFCRLIKGCIQLSCWPALDAALPVAPVDYVANAIVQLGNQPVATRQIFHLVHQEALKLSQLGDWVETLHYSLQRLPLKDWQATLMARAKGDPNNALSGLLPLLVARPTAQEQLTLPEMFALGRGPQFDAPQTRQALASVPLNCPLFDQPLLANFVDYFVQSGFLPAP